MGELQAGKDGTYYPAFPVLGLASDGRLVFLIGGGGGSTASKEVPNVVQAHRYDEATGKLTSIASLGTEKSVVIHLSYMPSTGLWLASAQAGCKVLELRESESSLAQVCEWQSELEGKEPTQNIARSSPTGDLIATGGTDGVVRVWRAVKLQEGQEPTLQQACPKQKEVLDLDFSPDGKLLAACDRSGACRLLDVATGEEKVVIKYDVAGVPQGTLAARGARFAAAGPDGAATVVIAASAPRGPAYLGLFGADGKKMTEVLVDKKPLTALAVDPAGRWAAVNLVSGGKRVYSLPKLKCVKKCEGAHELPAPCAAFLGEGTAISGSGDRSIHLLQVTRRGGSSCAGSVLVYMFTLLTVFAVVLYLLARIGLKGAALDQGRGEL